MRKGGNESEKRWTITKRKKLKSKELKMMWLKEKGEESIRKEKKKRLQKQEKEKKTQPKQAPLRWKNVDDVDHILQVVKENREKMKEIENVLPEVVSEVCRKLETGEINKEEIKDVQT